MKKLFLATLLLTILSITSPAVTYSAEFINTDKLIGSINKNYRDDLYIYGETINLSKGAIIDGDFFAFGSEARIDGPVTNDLNLLASEVSLTGPIGDDVRVSATKLDISGAVIQGDLMSASGKVFINSETEVLGKTFLAGSRINISGKLNDEANLWGEKVFFDGTTSGNLNINAKHITIGNNAIINGDLFYKKDANITIGDQSTIAGELIAKSFVKTKSKDLIETVAIMQVIKMISFVVLSVLLLVVFSRITKVFLEESNHKSAHSFLLGAGFVAGVPLLIIALLITVIGIPLAFILLLAYILTLVIGLSYAGILLGSWWQKVFTKNNKTNWAWATLGVVGIFLLMLIPILGWLVVFIIHSISTGILLKTAYQKVWLKRK